MLKIFYARLQRYVNQELPGVQAGFRKGRGTRDQIANIHCIIEKAREIQKNTYLCFIDYTKAYDCVDHDKLWKALREMGIPHHLTSLQRNSGTLDWFKIEKRVQQGCLLSPCLFNLYAEHMIRNAGLDDLHVRIKIGRRNINNLRHVDETTLMAEIKEELKSFLLRVKKESERAGLTDYLKKTRIMASSFTTAWQIGGGKVEL